MNIAAPNTTKTPIVDSMIRGDCPRTVGLRLSGNARHPFGIEGAGAQSQDALVPMATKRPASMSTPLVYRRPSLILSLMV
jgi:hypothetical protein